MKRRDLWLVTRKSLQFLVVSCWFRRGEGLGEDKPTAEFTEGAEGTVDKALRHRAGLIDSRYRNGPADGEGARGGSGRGRRRVAFFATFTTHDSRRGTRGQLVEGTDWVQVAGIFFGGKYGGSC